MNLKLFAFMGAALALTISVNGSAHAQETPSGSPENYGQQKLRHQRSALPNQYIVKFQDGVTKAEIRQIAKEFGVRNRPVLRLYKQALNGFAIRLSEQELSQDARVEYVEEDSLLSLNQVTMTACTGKPASDNHVPNCVTQQTPPSQTDRLGQTSSTLDALYTQSGTGKNINVYIMDTGILTTHTDFQGRATAAYDAIKDGNGSTDCNGHGTFVAGLVGGYVYGVAKEVNLRSVRVLDCSGNGSVSNIIAAIDWISANAPKPSVVNMSFGGAASSSLDSAVQGAINLGYIYVVAAGNENMDVSGVSPARVSSAYTVGSRDSLDNRSSFSNYGSLVDYYLPGENVYSTFNASTTSQAVGSGTSFSAPLVSGLFAIQLEWNPATKKAGQTITSQLNSSALGSTVNSPTSTTISTAPSLLQTDKNIGKLKNFGTPTIYQP
jgi:subtilisin family serine protease